METGHASKAIRFVDPSFSHAESSNYHLSVHVDPDKASCAVINTHTGAILAVFSAASDGRSQRECLSQLLDSDALESGEFASVSLAVDGMPKTLVPQPLNHPRAAEQLLAFSYGRSQGQVQSTPVEALKGNMCFTADSGAVALVRERFPQATVHSSPALLIQTLLRKHRFARGHRLYADVSFGFANYYLLADQQLLLFNAFQTTAPVDLLYHALNICQQHELPAMEVEVHLSGEVDPGSAHFKLLSEHFPKVDINFGLDYHRLSLGLSGVRKQRHLGLFNQYVCVS